MLKSVSSDLSGFCSSTGAHGFQYLVQMDSGGFWSLIKKLFWILIICAGAFLAG
jgi:hypothetical protein